MTIAKKDSPVMAALAAFIGGIVEAKISELKLDHDIYTSEAPAPGKSRRVHNARCRSGEVVGAYRDGRMWVCTRKAWLAANATKPKFATVHRIRPSDEDLDAEAAAAIAASDMRPTRSR